LRAGKRIRFEVAAVEHALVERASRPAGKEGRRHA
jgi:hypothetical protein